MRYGNSFEWDMEIVFSEIWSGCQWDGSGFQWDMKVVFKEMWKWFSMRYESGFQWDMEVVFNEMWKWFTAFIVRPIADPRNDFVCILQIGNTANPTMLASFKEDIKPPLGVPHWEVR